MVFPNSIASRLAAFSSRLRALPQPTPPKSSETTPKASSRPKTFVVIKPCSKDVLVAFENSKDGCFDTFEGREDLLNLASQWEDENSIAVVRRSFSIQTQHMRDRGANDGQGAEYGVAVLTMTVWYKPLSIIQE